MNSELIMRSDVLDILFEKRNKDYGAYRLRKFYKNRLFKSLGVMVAVVIVFSAFTLVPDNPARSGDLNYEEMELGHIPASPKAPEVKPRLIKPLNIKPVSSIKLLSKIIIVDRKDSAEILHDLNNRAIENNTNIGVNTADIQLVGAGSFASEDANEPGKVPEPPIDITNPVDNPEIMPEYPGGMAALRKFLVRNLTNPRDLDEGELISVKIKFVVGYDGKLQRFELVQDGGREFNEEVIRVLKKMPAWIPGKSKGQNVSVFYTIPVKFIGEG